jgi:hypothetical protein
MTFPINDKLSRIVAFDGHMTSSYSSILSVIGMTISIGYLKAIPMIIFINIFS